MKLIVKSMGRKNQLGIQLMAVGYEGQDGREYFSPTKEHLKAAAVAAPADVPLGELPDNTRWFSPPLFGFTRYTDLYTSRQLHLMTTLCNLVEEARRKAAEEAKKPISHEVKEGNNLTKLAAQYGVSPDEIRKANNIKGDNIRIGQKLIIPKKHSAKQNHQEQQE